ncbi:MAG: hypothetical protein N2321_11875 [Melioribacteraceae bacterium]|nr:hypothetical protein [Melioribacteraceae bacterium]
MKKLLLLFALVSFMVYSNNIAQTTKPTTPQQHGKNFVDKNGDGYNDNAPDHDGDGIPNGLDPDYKGAKIQKNKFVDLNGDGINDNAGKGKGKSGKSGNNIGNKNNGKGNSENQAGTQGSGRGMMFGKKK